jgi:hypothetical protein
MPRRRKRVGVAGQSDADLLERVLAREDLDAYERDAFEEMSERLLSRVEQYGDDARGLKDPQRDWVERVAAREERVPSRMTGDQFGEFVRSVLGRGLRLRIE